MLKLPRLGMIPHSKLSYLTILLLGGTPVCSLVMPLNGRSAWTCCLGEDPEGHLGLLRHTGVAICASGAIKIRRFSSETHLKSDAEVTDHRGRHYVYEGRPVARGIWKMWLSKYGLRTLRSFGKKCRRHGDMKVYRRRSIWLDYPWRG